MEDNTSRLEGEEGYGEQSAHGSEQGETTDAVNGKNKRPRDVVEDPGSNRGESQRECGPNEKRTSSRS